MSGRLSPPEVGVLGVQGDFALHRGSLEALGFPTRRVSLPEHLDGLAALVMPGGESTAMVRLFESTGLRAPLERFVREKPVLATCAGLILLARETTPTPLPHPPLAALDIVVERNAYGRQVASFAEAVDAPALGAPFPAVFIRAPRIRSIGPGVEVVARRGSEPVGVRSGRVVGLCFHPELTQDLRFHRWFLEQVAGLPVPAPVSGERAA